MFKFIGQLAFLALLWGAIQNTACGPIIRRALIDERTWTPQEAETAIRVGWVAGLKRQWAERPRVIWLEPKPNKEKDCAGKYDHWGIKGCVSGLAWLETSPMVIQVVFPRDGSGRFDESALAHELAHAAGYTHGKMDETKIVEHINTKLTAWEDTWR